MIDGALDALVVRFAGSNGPDALARFAKLQAVFERDLSPID